jgi:NitT/TauT family transport system substrate-binding protein
MTQKKTYSALFLFCLFWAFFSPHLTAEEKPRQPVRLSLQWLPQSQFAGYYMAVEKGIYRDAGFEVSLLHTGPGPSSLDYLVAGQADFATFFLADALVSGRDPVPLVQVAQIVQRSNLMLVAWKDMGIHKPVDLNGKAVSFWSNVFSVAFRAFFKLNGISPQERTQNYSVNLFLNRGVAACSAMEYNELHRIYQAGVDYDRLTLFMMRDGGLGFPEDGIYATEEFVRTKPQLSRDFRQACLAGWEYARQHPKETLDVVLRESRLAGVPVNPAHSRWMLEKILQSIFVDADSRDTGRLDRRVYDRTVDTLKKADAIQTALPFELFAPLETEEH